MNFHNGRDEFIDERRHPCKDLVAPAPTGDEITVQPAATALSLLDAIQRYIDSVEAGEETPPADVGAAHGYTRKSVINAALALAIAKALRRCQRKSAYTSALLYYVSVRSDNANGRCTDSAGRISEYLGCAEDVARDIRDALVMVGALRCEKRPGLPAAVWLPYTAEAFLHSDFAIFAALAPPRLGPGRPARHSEKTPGIYHPTFLEKPRVLKPKTPGVDAENPGHLTPDCKNSSLQDLDSRLKGGVLAHSRPLEVLKNGADHLWRALQAECFPFPPRGDDAKAWQQAAAKDELVAALTADQATIVARAAKRALEAASSRHVAEWPGVGEVARQIEGYIAEAIDTNRRIAEWDTNQARWAAIDRDKPAVDAIERRHPVPEIDGPFGKRTLLAKADRERAVAAETAAAGLTLRKPGEQRPDERLRPRSDMPPFAWSKEPSLISRVTPEVVRSAMAEWATRVARRESDRAIANRSAGTV